MIKVHLPHDLQIRLVSALNRAGFREIGGILMGENVGDEEFRIVDLTIQTRTGTLASFIRHVSAAVGALQSFFKKTNHNYTIFNYLGEWHSHPQFSLLPSQQDIQSMKDIITDNNVGANFIILLIIKLISEKDLAATGTVFLPDSFFKCEVILEKQLE
jgi:proteasome lid subunit RPN8/RPN11